MLGRLQEGKSITWKGKKIEADKATSLVKGKSVAIITDTVPCEGAYKLAKDVDILISEATYASNLEEKGAEYGHMTSKQAAEMANRSSAKQLILTHFSARYKNTSELEDEARTYFDNVITAEDFMKINL